MLGDESIIHLSLLKKKKLLKGEMKIGAAVTSSYDESAKKRGWENKDEREESGGSFSVFSLVLLVPK